jgi:hypothetical protein
MPEALSRFLSFYGFLIKKRDFGEGNSILSIIDRDNGLLEIISFGSGTEKSSRRESLLVTELISGVCYRKDRETAPSLKEASCERDFGGITSSYRRLSYVFFIFEILSVMLQKEEPLPVFGLLLGIMDRLDNTDEPEKYSIYFIIVLLRTEGLLPSFQTPGDYIIFRADLEKSGFRLGNGSIRLIKDIGGSSSPFFMDDKKISRSVISNMLEFISIIIMMNYDREINSLKMINGRF